MLKATPDVEQDAPSISRSSAHKGVKHAARVFVTSGDFPCRVDAIAEGDKGALTGACARAWSVEGGDGAVESAQEAVKDAASVDVLSRDCASRINACALGTSGSNY
jgi:hypothetical protein